MLAECYRNSFIAIHCKRSLSWFLFSVKDFIYPLPLYLHHFVIAIPLLTYDYSDLCHQAPQQLKWKSCFISACLSELAKKSVWQVKQVTSCLAWGVSRASLGSFGEPHRGSKRLPLDDVGLLRTLHEAWAVPHAACPSVDSNHRLLSAQCRKSHRCLSQSSHAHRPFACSGRLW